MRRRGLLFAVLLLAVSPLAMAARRRAATPGGPACDLGVLVPATYAGLMTIHGEFLYFLDDYGSISRVPKDGGTVETLSDPFEDDLPIAIAADDTNVYVSVLPFQALFTPTTGSVVAVPNSGGVVRTLASGVDTAFTLQADGGYVYWAAPGILDFDNGAFVTPGKIERIRADGSARQVLAEGVEGSYSLALDAQDVYFGQTGDGEGGGTIGLYRVSRSGGSVTLVDPSIAPFSLAVSGRTVAVLGGVLPDTFGLFTIDLDTVQRRELLTDESLAATLLLIDRRAYVVAEGDEANVLEWVSFDAPGAPTIVRTDLDGDAAVLDGCAAIITGTDGDMIRVAR
jgi:hypothetical protein